LNLVKVNRKAADRAAGGHPWLFSSDITDRGDAQPGDAVGVADPKGRILGVAHYSSTSQIALRLLKHFEGENGGPCRKIENSGHRRHCLSHLQEMRSSGDEEEFFHVFLIS